jgi:hypothetical protein
MTGLRESGGFGLLYDERNPYFSGAGDWPGWAPVLQQTANADSRVVVRAISWQNLIPLLPSRGRGEVLRWAAEKHGFDAP